MTTNHSKFDAASFKKLDGDLSSQIEQCEEKLFELYGETYQRASLFWQRSESMRSKGERKEIWMPYLTLRIKPTISKDGHWYGAFSIIWQKSRTYKNSKPGIKKPYYVVSEGLKKNASLNKYQPAKFKGFLPWEAEAAIELEESFETIRKTVSALVKARRTLIAANSLIQDVLALPNVNGADDA